MGVQPMHPKKRRDEPNRRQKRRTAHHSADAYCNQFRRPVAVFAQKVFFWNPKRVEFVNKVLSKHEQFPALAPAYVAKCHSFSIGKPLAYLLKGRMAGKGVTSFDRPGLWHKTPQISP